MKKLRDMNRWAKGFVTLWLLTLFLALSPLIELKQCYADTAEVLPKGRSVFFVEGKLYSPVNKRYGPTGNEEDVAQDLNTNLNSSVFPGLLALEALFPPAVFGFANLGHTNVKFQYHFDIFEFNYGYGITDKLSFGIKVPYWHVKNDVDANLDTTNATYGKNSNFGAGPFAPAPYIPLPLGGVPLTSRDVQNLLGPGLDVNNNGTVDVPGYGFKEVKNWNQDALGDIQIGLRYQYYKSDNWRLALAGGVMCPTGQEDDPDSLVDYPTGSGTWAALFRLHNDYVGMKNLFLSASLKYDWFLPDHNYMRVPDNVDNPLTRNKETVDRDIGSFFELELYGSYQFLEGLSFFTKYRYGYKWKDSYSGDRGYDYDSLESQSNQKAQDYTIGFEYSTIPLYLTQRFPVPMSAFIGYRNRFAGENVLKSEYINVGLTIYF